MRPLANISIICQHAAAAIRGPVIECGVYEGVTSVALREALGYAYPHFAADTFEGMPYDGSPTEVGGGFTKGYLAPANKEEVINSLEAHAITVLEGNVEDTLKQVQNIRFAFVFLDLDLEVPTRCAIDVLARQVMKGGRLGIHDYKEDERYCLRGIANVVNQSELRGSQWKEVYRPGVGHNDNKFIFFEKKE